MSKLFNLYCDESCHLENDLYKVMVLGSVWCEAEKTSSINIDMRSIETNRHISKLLRAFFPSPVSNSRKFIKVNNDEKEK